MKKRILFFIILFIIVLLGSTVYGIMLNEQNYSGLDFGDMAKRKVLYFKHPKNVATEDEQIEFIQEISKLTKEEAVYLIEECNKKELDLFVVLGLIRVESNFDTMTVGTHGERGLGQLMANTAKPLAKNLGIKYEPNSLFKPKYNIFLFTTQLQYLSKVLNGDIHKILTAYNRGEYGLKRYMASRGHRINPAESTYSHKVLHYKNKYYKQFKEEYLSYWQ
ncbi:transglycosylase SLT domain-containing protein [Dethiothermospora halolimnae]|uniref:lytic transglycosylase domain-containing protein n=1 Tax=Dethiothermospora halolimnae TaxID=3114390 RepID=UPI003CCBAE21